MPNVSYEHHYGLKEPPFSIVPDPRFLYLSASHREALAHLLYGLGTQGGGIVLLTGPAGTGKTLLCRALLDAIGDEVDLAVIEEAAPEVDVLLMSVCRGFGMEALPQASVQQHLDRLNAFLQVNHSRGRSSVLLIDGAHRLSLDVLEQVRLLTNLETHERKLLQVLLVGRPELQTMVARHDLRQLSQRIVARCRLRPLTAGEIVNYVHQRLATAGGSASLLAPRLAGVLQAFSQGVPRTINLLCDRALVGAALRGKHQLETADLTRAAQELGLSAAPPPMWRQSSSLIAAMAMLTICAAAMVVAGQESFGPASRLDASQVPQRPVDLTSRAASALLGAAQSTTEAPRRLTNAGVMPVDADAFKWPEGLSHRRSAVSAHAGLLQRWDAAPTGSMTCGDQLPSGLRCARMRGGLAELRALDLPVVLHLADDRGRHVDALLSQVKDGALLLEVDAAPRSLPIMSLRDWWQGEYTLAWRAPPGANGPLRSGSRGPAVAWLHKRLAQWRERPVVGLGEAFDAELQREVRAFQIAEGLEPDGIAGVKTFARLSARTNTIIPTLAVDVAPLDRVGVMP
jgi:general secretion pathway protein A